MSKFNLNAYSIINATVARSLNFKNRASYIYDGRTAILQMLHFIYFFNKYKYWVF